MSERVFTKDDIRVGFRYFDQWGEFRVMAVAEGWYMCRRKGATAVCFKVKDLVDALNGNRLCVSKPVKI
mgnify:FL=1